MSSSPEQLYAPYSCMDNASQEIARVICQKISSSVSIMGSSHILSLVYKKWKHDRSRVDPYQRIMAGYSAFDILFSFFYWFLGSWITPRETGWYGAVGNTATCTMQGFFSAMVYGTSMYQFTLSLQMLLLITFMWTPSQFEMVIEKKLHCFNIISTFAIASLPLFFGGYNPKCGTCDPVPLPFGCGEWMGATDDADAAAATCLRGNETLANIYLFLFWVVISFMTVFCSGAMLSIYLSVYLQERKMVQYRFSTEEGEDGSDGDEDYPESKRIRQSLILYTSSFYICWIVPLVLWYAPHGVPSLDIVGDVLFSLMGFFNMIIYVHSKCVKYQQEHPGTSLFKCYIFIIFNNQLNFVGSFKRKPAIADENDQLDIIPTMNETCQFNNESEVLELPNRHRSTTTMDETSPMSFHDEGDHQTWTPTPPTVKKGGRMDW